MSLEIDAQELLDSHWREGMWNGLRYGFSAPSHVDYPYQWYWDSAFHAYIRNRWSPTRATEELTTLLRAQDADGFIGHTIMWGGSLHWSRVPYYNIARRHAFMTRTIQPPLLPWIWSMMIGNPADNPLMVNHYNWLKNRDLSDNGMVWLIQPDESGLDANPKFDHVWGKLAQGTPLFPLLIARNRRYGFDARRIQQAGHPVVAEVMTNVIKCLSDCAMGKPSITATIIEQCYDQTTGRFHDQVINPAIPTPRQSLPLTWDTLSPLVLPDLPGEIVKRLVEQVYLPHFRHYTPLPSVAPSDRAYSPHERHLGLHRHWRGPSWVNSAWLVWLGLRHHGYNQLADEMAERLRVTIEASGFREYYDVNTGQGMAAQDFGWSALVLDMIEPHRSPYPWLTSNTQ